MANKPNLKDTKLHRGWRYLVIWVDICQHVKWSSEEDIDNAIKDFEKGVETTGYFVRETDEVYVFTSGLSKTGQEEKYFDLVIYPKGVIKKIVKL